MKYFFFLLFSTISFVAQSAEIEDLVYNFQIEKSKKNKCELSSEIALEYIKINIDSALYYSDITIKLAIETKNNLQLSKGYLIKGVALQKIGDYLLAIDYIFKSINIKEKLKDTKGLINSRLSVGNCYLEYGNVHESESKFEDALKQYEKAKLNYNEALNIAVFLKDSLEIAKVYQNLGTISYLLYEYDQGITYYQLSQEFEPDSTKSSKYPESQMNIASCLFEMGKDKEATEIYHHVSEIFKNNNQLKQWINNNINLAAVYWDLDPNLAIISLLEADSVALEMKDANIRIGITERLASLYQNVGDNKNALKYYKTYDKLKSTVLSTETETKLEDLRLQYNNEKTEKELLISESEKEKALSKNKMLIASVIVALSFIVFLIIFLIQRQRANKLKRLKNKAKFDQEVTQLLAYQELDRIDSMLTGQETERKRIAVDLHDRLGSLLSATRMYVDSGANEDKALQENKDKVCELLDKAITETRDIAHNLESGILSKFGLMAAINDLKETIEGSGAIKFEFSAKSFEDRLDSETEIILYRIIQEVVSNVLKHSKANKLKLVFSETENDKNQLIIEDNGKGFDLDQASMGMGLKNIRARVNKIDGIMDMKSNKNTGTTISIIF